MHRIDTPTAQKDKFGAGKNGFTKGYSPTGTPATEIDETILDALQEEICGVIEGEAIALNKNDKGQLYKAIKKLIANLELKSASKRDVGNDLSSKIPDMSFFQSYGDFAFRLPNGKLFQFGSYTGTAQRGTINLPIPFVKTDASPIISFRGSDVAASSCTIIHDDSSLSKSSFSWKSIGTQFRFNWFIIGE